MPITAETRPISTHSLVYGLAALIVALAGWTPVAHAQPEVKGDNVEAVIYTDQGKVAGAFVKSGGDTWIQQSNVGRFTFTQRARDEWSVYLEKNDGSGQVMQLDLYDKSVDEVDLGNGVKGKNLFAIKQAFSAKGCPTVITATTAAPMAAHVKGPNVQMVIFLAGNKLGCFAQTQAKKWVAMTSEGKYSFTEFDRDPWSVYLRHDTEGTAAQIDLYRQEIGSWDEATQSKQGPAEFKVITAFAARTTPDSEPMPDPTPMPSKVTNFWIGNNPANDNLIFVRRGNIWKEYHKNGAEFAGDWQEVARDTTSVTLHDAGRDYWLRLTETEGLIDTDGTGYARLIEGRWSKTLPSIPDPMPTPKLPKLVKIKSKHTGRFMVTPSGVADNALIYCRGTEPQGLVFETDGTADNVVFKLQGRNLWLSYRDLTGAVKLFSSPADANYKLEGVFDGGKLSPCAIFNLKHNQYMGLGNYLGNPDEPYVVRDHRATNPTSRWELVEVAP